MLKRKLMFLLFMSPFVLQGLCAANLKPVNAYSSVDEETMKKEKPKEEVKAGDFLKNPLVEIKLLNLKARPVSVQAAITASIDEYQKTGQADVILAGNNRLLFPYGLSEATLTCAVLRICSVELEEGETIIGSPFLGDTTRWWIGLTQTGTEKAAPLIIVKPLVNEPIETNMLIVTNLRKYYLRLKSVTDGAFTPMIGFYYPQEPQRIDNTKIIVDETKDKQNAHAQNVDIENLSFNYYLQGKKRPWYPEKVYDDGKKVYIHLPEKAKYYETPVVFVVGEDGKYELVNYRLKSSKEGKLYFVVDRLFNRAVLVLSQQGSKEERIHIVKMRN